MAQGDFPAVGSLMSSLFFHFPLDTGAAQRSNDVPGGDGESVGFPSGSSHHLQQSTRHCFLRASCSPFGDFPAKSERPALGGHGAQCGLYTSSIGNHLRACWRRRLSGLLS